RVPGGRAAPRHVERGGRDEGRPDDLRGLLDFLQEAARAVRLQRAAAQDLRGEVVTTDRDRRARRRRTRAVAETTWRPPRVPASSCSPPRPRSPSPAPGAPRST